jgi:hypothetical protein
MSRSRRKVPIAGITTARSEASDKYHNHHKLRQRVKVAMRGEAEVLPLMREVTNLWWMAKDGKRWFGDTFLKVFRK